MSPESALIAELETSIQPKRRRVLNFGNDGMESSNGERTPVGLRKIRLEIDLKYGGRGATHTTHLSYYTRETAVVL